MTFERRSKIMNARIFKRGEIYWINLDNEKKKGSELFKNRPGVIISNDKQNQFSQAVIISLITSKTDKIYPFEVAVKIEGKIGKILTDQMQTIDKSRCLEKISQLNDEELEKLVSGIHTVLGLTKCYFSKI